MKACECEPRGVLRTTGPWNGPEDDEDDFSAGAGLLEDEMPSPAMEAQGQRETEQWEK